MFFFVNKLDIFETARNLGFEDYANYLQQKISLKQESQEIFDLLRIEVDNALTNLRERRVMFSSTAQEQQSSSELSSTRKNRK